MQLVKHIFLIIALTLLVLQADAQLPDTDSIIVVRGIIQDGDTIPLFELEEIRVYSRTDYEYLYQKRRNRRLVRNVKKAYPYSKLAGYELRKLDEQLASLEDEKERETYVNQAEKAIMNRFEQEVKRLSITQGIILVKLIDRETGHTSYEVIKNLKGGLTAFFWQGIARFFGNNLKTEYDPYGEDLLIEDIVQGIEAGFI